MATFDYALTSAEADMKPKVDIYDFGDEYEQRVGKGIANLLEKWNVAASGIPKSVATAIHNFLKNENGITSFDWTTPLGLSIKVVCRSWNVTPMSEDDEWSFTGLFEEVRE